MWKIKKVIEKNIIVPKRDEINIIIKHEDVKYVIDDLKAVKNEYIHDKIFIPYRKGYNDMD